VKQVAGGCLLQVLFIRVPGSGFDNDPLAAAGDQLIVGFR
jgi:hypothetical protein